jgi:hypothetical protein
MAKLSILIPARHEQFLLQTIQDILANKRGDTDVIVACDGEWPMDPIPDHPDVHLLHFHTSIGQRAATNQAARVTNAKYLMKLDAHCALSEGFDVALMQPYETEELSDDTTTIPRLYNLHVFDWVCQTCGERTYQGPDMTTCAKCKGTAFAKDLVWKPRMNRLTDFARYNCTPQFQYWSSYKHRPEAQGDLADVMCSVGACWLLTADRYWYQGGCDEAHGSWGQQGIEVANKAWLSGGRQVVNKRAWYAHAFRTQGGSWGFPYPMSDKQVQKARSHSRSMWFGNTWAKQTRPMSWVLDKFWPVPEWTDDANAEVLKQVREAGARFATKPAIVPVAPAAPTFAPLKGIVYYSDMRADREILYACQRQLLRAAQDIPIVSVTLGPTEFGRNIPLEMTPGRLAYFTQILTGLEACESEIVFLCEHDCVYPACHFDFIPPERDKFYYNQAVWRLNAQTGWAVTQDMMSVSGLCAYRSLLLDHYRAKVEQVRTHGYNHNEGYEPGIREGRAVGWRSEVPYVDIRHGKNLTASRWSPHEFRTPGTCVNWQEAGEIPGWGQTQGRVASWLREHAT